MLISGGMLLLRNRTTSSLLIHQTMRANSVDYLVPNSWTHWHPNALCVHWSDEDNAALVRMHYPYLYQLYTQQLPLPVQKTDLARLLYMHRYGGIYADIDYEARAHVGDALRELPYDAMAVGSPVLFNEVFQNSLLWARVPGHAFWLDTVESIGRIVAFVTNGCTFSSSCALLGFFEHPLTRQLAHIVATQYVTGSAVLDKTYVRRGGGQGDRVGLMDSARFFHGDLAYHHHHNSWVKLGDALAPLLSLVVLAWLLWTVAVAWLVVRCRRYGNGLVVVPKAEGGGRKTC